MPTTRSGGARRRPPRHRRRRPAASGARGPPPPTAPTMATMDVKLPTRRHRRRRRGMRVAWRRRRSRGGCALVSLFGGDCRRVSHTVCRVCVYGWRLHVSTAQTSGEVGEKSFCLTFIFLTTTTPFLLPSLSPPTHSQSLHRVRARGGRGRRRRAGGRAGGSAEAGGAGGERRERDGGKREEENAAPFFDQPSPPHHTQSAGYVQRSIAHTVRPPPVTPASTSKFGSARFTRAHGASVTAIALSSDASSAFSVAKDGSALRIDVETGSRTPLARHPPPTGGTKGGVARPPRLPGCAALLAPSPPAPCSPSPPPTMAR